MDQDFPRNKYLLGKKHLKYFGIIIAVLILLSPLFFWWYYNAALNRQNYPEETIAKSPNIPLEADVIIPSGATTDEISDLLYKKDLINSKTLFKLYLLQTQKTIKAGHYRVPFTIDVKDLVEAFQKGTFDIRLTFLEGWRVEEYADYITKQFNDPILGKEFLTIAKPFEGYLFPDTYFMPKLSSAQLLLGTLKANFDERTKNIRADYTLKSKGKTSGLSFADTINLASILEREVANGADRSVVAGILIKRIENGWPLDADATVQYAVASPENWWPSKITQDGLDKDSPYNTRKNQGLPPTPICNPGLAAISAASAPVSSEYWFYLSGKDGKTHFAKTIEEHNQDIVLYL